MVVMFEENWNGYVFSSHKDRLDIEYITQWLSKNSYWASGVPESVVRTAVENSLAIGIYSGEKQVGFARLITDYATYGYLADVFIDERHRGKGLSTHLLQIIFSAPVFLKLRRIMLATRDAHTLYEKIGFKALASPANFMEIARPDIYKQS